MDKKNFDELVELAMQQPGRAAMKPVVEKEILHYDIFHALNKGNLLKDLVFQGGTSLRLCRGSNRFSEDLDFAGGREFTSEGMRSIKECIEDYIGARYGLKVEVKEPKASPFDAVKVDKWQVSVETAPEQRNMPRQRIKIEIANIPAYTRELVPLRANYEFLQGQGYDSVLVNTESLNEVMADKLLAFPVAKNIRYRDIWDLAWLGQQGAIIVPDYIEKKIADYQVENYEAQLEQAIAKLPEIIHSKEFHDQMSRFIDADTLADTLEKDQFLTYLVSTVGKQFQAVHEHFSPGDEEEEAAPTFRM